MNAQTATVWTPLCMLLTSTSVVSKFGTSPYLKANRVQCDNLFDDLNRVIVSVGWSRLVFGSMTGCIEFNFKINTIPSYRISSEPAHTRKQNRNLSHYRSL